MDLIKKFSDSVTSLYNTLINRRNALTNNELTNTRASFTTLRAIQKTGIGSKILNIKVGYALKNTLQFASKEDELFYNTRLARPVKRVSRWMVAYGRGIVVIQEPHCDLAKPLGRFDPLTCHLRVFSGDMVTVPMVSIDLGDPDYQKPQIYQVRGFNIHPSRVVPFNYVEPVELDAPTYFYGGISEFELIMPQLVADGIVERSVPQILEKNSTLFYKVKGFKEAMQRGDHQAMVDYFTLIEDRRSIYGAVILDAEDAADVVDQTLTNLADVDSVTLRRLAMVTGIPLAWLIGENVKGLNSTGDNERLIFQDMIEALQSDYLEEPINALMKKLGQGVVKFKENQGDSPQARIEYETKAIINAKELREMGEDYQKYLTDKNIIKPDEMAGLLDEDETDELPAVEEVAAPGQSSQPTEEAINPKESLNGAQVTAILEIVARITKGEITKDTAVKIVAAAFPLSEQEAAALLADVVEGQRIEEPAA